MIANINSRVLPFFYFGKSHKQKEICRNQNILLNNDSCLLALGQSKLQTKNRM